MLRNNRYLIAISLKSKLGLCGLFWIADRRILPVPHGQHQIKTYHNILQYASLENSLCPRCGVNIPLHTRTFRLLFNLNSWLGSTLLKNTSKLTSQMRPSFPFPIPRYKKLSLLFIKWRVPLHFLNHPTHRLDSFKHSAALSWVTAILECACDRQTTDKTIFFLHDPWTRKNNGV